MPEGQQVEVTVRPTPDTDADAARHRLLSYKGVPDWSEEDDQILEEISASRRSAEWREPSEQEPER